MAEQGVHAIEVALRYGSAVSLTVATVVLLTMLSRRRLRPWPAWLYLAGVVTLIAVWRWVVVLLITPELLPEGFPAALVPWVQPVNQTLYLLTGIAISILTVVSARARREP